MWSFTRSGQTPCPAVVCRQLVDTAEGWTIEMKARCFGTTQQCDGIMEDFKALNKAMIDSIQRSQQ